MSDAPEEFHLERFLPYLVHRVGSRLAEGFDELSKEAGVSLQEWRILVVLFEFGSLPMGDIARRTSINASTMTRLVGQMEKRKLVERKRPVANQRSVFVKLLEPGRKTVLVLIPRVLEFESELNSCFTDTELQMFKSLLIKFFQNLTGETGDEAERLAG